MRNGTPPVLSSAAALLDGLFEHPVCVFLLSKICNPFQPSESIRRISCRIAHLAIQCVHGIQRDVDTFLPKMLG